MDNLGELLENLIGFIVIIVVVVVNLYAKFASTKSKRRTQSFRHALEGGPLSPSSRSTVSTAPKKKLSDYAVTDYDRQMEAKRKAAEARRREQSEAWKSKEAAMTKTWGVAEEKDVKTSQPEKVPAGNKKTSPQYKSRRVLKKRKKVLFSRKDIVKAVIFSEVLNRKYT